MTQIFISYKREDQTFTEHLRDHLRAWGHSTWVDIDNIEKGAYWREEIDKGLETSDIVVGVLSPASVTSRNVKNEWDWALENQKPLLLLLLQPCKIPHSYVSINYIDFSGDHQRGFAQLETALKVPVTVYRVPAVKERPADRNRERLLQKVQAFWVEGVLEKSLHGAALIELGLSQKYDAVENPWDAVLQHSDYGEYTLPAGTHISQLFHDLNGELLILGQPGSGKTTMLLELARDLVARAQTDPAQSIPVVFNLSLWADERLLLADWLADELNTKYQLSSALSKEWVANDQLTLLLDGLDEVRAEHREACVEAINTFRQQHGLTDLVVCSRITDYELLTTRLQLQGAVVLQPLTPDQIDAYLSELGDELTALRTLLQQDERLQELATSPLMLSIMVLAYRGVPVTIQTSPEEQRRQLFDAYVRRMFERKGKHSPYTSAQTTTWLSLLAKMMLKHSETVFFIERMQPDWLDNPLIHHLYLFFARLIFGLSGGILVGVVSGILFGQAGVGEAPLIGWVLGAAATGVLMLVWGLAGGQALGSASGVTFGLVLGLAYGISGGETWSDKLAFGLVFAMAAGLIFGVIGMGITALLGQKITFREHIEVVDVVNWSWRDALQGLIVGILFGICGGIVASLLFDVWSGLLVAAALSLPCGLVLAVGFAVGGSEIEMRTAPNQGIWRSARRMLWFGVSAALITGMLVGAIGGPAWGLFLGLMAGAIIMMTFGGVPVSQHVLLRLFLTLTGKIPLNFAHFLDFAVDRVLLRRVGGGYIFVHRLLLEYFAEKD